MINNKKKVANVYIVRDLSFDDDDFLDSIVGLKSKARTEQLLKSTKQL
jgi:hypothetical protein